MQLKLWRFYIGAEYSYRRWGIGFDSEWNLPRYAWLSLAAGPLSAVIEYRKPFTLVKPTARFYDGDYFDETSL